MDTNERIVWTLMCSTSAIVSSIFAFLPLVLTGGKTGLIAAVGVDEKARGRGDGLALVVKAVESLRERGVEGVFIDSVTIRGFYEQLGFETYWEYEGYVWKKNQGSDGCSSMPPPPSLLRLDIDSFITQHKFILAICQGLKTIVTRSN